MAKKKIRTEETIQQENARREENKQLIAAVQDIVGIRNNVAFSRRLGVDRRVIEAWKNDGAQPSTASNNAVIKSIGLDLLHSSFTNKILDIRRPSEFTLFREIAIAKEWQLIEHPESPRSAATATGQNELGKAGIKDKEGPVLSSMPEIVGILLGQSFPDVAPSEIHDGKVYLIRVTNRKPVLAVLRKFDEQTILMGTTRGEAPEQIAIKDIKELRLPPIGALH
ncbi:hypothetical protein DCC81_06540 [Chitinophaga parva]|uniref:Uncharacterized protein n=1 Tax=Chitinophaga parva TaxID=2169414 RepID=A0A2T7BN61_9BACT|nr:hypothetical protein [Chitinophaga parva]PUZ29117.1 hypothetical protein DCC81_06540 [Chitinophaga parva]